MDFQFRRKLIVGLAVHIEFGGIDRADRDQEYEQVDGDCNPQGDEGRLRDILGRFFDVLNPIIVRMTGANINRRTTDNVAMAGWKTEIEENLSSDIVRWIEARP